MVKPSAIISIVVAIAVLAILIWNVVYLSGVKRAIQGGSNIGLSLNGANIIYWINILAIVAVGLYLLYSIWSTVTDKGAADIVGALAQKVAPPKAKAM